MMKKLTALIGAVGAAVLILQAQPAYAGGHDHGWATAGKILTGVVIGQALVGGLACPPRQVVVHQPVVVNGYAPAAVCAPPPPVVYRPVVYGPPPVAYAPVTYVAPPYTTVSYSSVWYAPAPRYYGSCGSSFSIHYSSGGHSSHHGWSGHDAHRGHGGSHGPPPHSRAAPVHYTGSHR